MKSPAGKRGGRREGAGRPPAETPTVKRGVSLTVAEIDYIKALGFGSLSAGIRVLLANYRVIS